MNVLSTKPSSKPGQGFVKIKMDGEDGAVIEAWTPELEMVKALADKPIPNDWILRDGPRGKQLLPPRKGGGGSYSQSKEAFDRSAESRRAWQLEEEDRKDRRTALMTAFEHGGGNPTGMVLRDAEAMYDWLRDHKTSAPARGEHTAGEKPGDWGSGADTGTGGDPAGRETVAAASSPGSTHYPVDPAQCSHKTASGAWVKWTAAGDLCPKCGTSRIVAMEGTTEDLGSA